MELPGWLTNTVNGVTGWASGHEGSSTPEGNPERYKADAFERYVYPWGDWASSTVIADTSTCETKYSSYVTQMQIIESEEDGSPAWIAAAAILQTSIPGLAQTWQTHWPKLYAGPMLDEVARMAVDAAQDAFIYDHSNWDASDVEALDWSVHGRDPSEIASRPLFWGAEGVLPGGAGSGTTPLPFVAGGPWQATQFEGKSFLLEPVLQAGFLGGRRPGRNGYIIEHPHRYATLHVIDIDGVVKLSTTDFALSRVAKRLGEKFQTISTFDGNHLIFQCEKGAIYQLGFTMVNAKNFDWLRAFQLNWDRLFKGSKLATQQARLYILYGGTLLGGYPLSMAISETSEAQPIAQMSLDMYITDDVPLPDMVVVNAQDGIYNWGDEPFVVGSGVSGMALALNTEMPNPTSLGFPSNDPTTSMPPIGPGTGYMELPPEYGPGGIPLTPSE